MVFYCTAFSLLLLPNPVRTPSTYQPLGSARRPHNLHLLVDRSHFLDGSPKQIIFYITNHLDFLHFVSVHLHLLLLLYISIPLFQNSLILRNSHSCLHFYGLFRRRFSFLFSRGSYVSSRETVFAFSELGAVNLDHRRVAAISLVALLSDYHSSLRSMLHITFGFVTALNYGITSLLVALVSCVSE